jgi:hypothetical protein
VVSELIEPRRNSSSLALTSKVSPCIGSYGAALSSVAAAP